MKLITRDTDYAVRALTFISRRKKEVISVEEMVGSLRIPRSFLRQILQRLTNEGLLKSSRGAGGGFSLRRAPEKIFLIDLIGIFQGNLEFTEHTLKKKPCPHAKRCALKEELDIIENCAINRLKPITIASLIRKGAKKRRRKCK